MSLSNSTLQKQKGKNLALQIQIQMFVQLVKSLKSLLYIYFYILSHCPDVRGGVFIFFRKKEEQIKYSFKRIYIHMPEPVNWLHLTETTELVFFTSLGQLMIS